ncbi:MAG: hypothetical protein QOI02_1670 [Actinomycetota bacterium]|nr:hypothetical protein [Actinomycetota bacterium]
MRYARIAGGLVALALSASPALAKETPVYGTTDQVEGHSYSYWDMTWARFEWEPGGKASPLNNPTPCNHLVVGNVFILPGPNKSATVTCKLAHGLSIYLPTGSGLSVKTSKSDTRASLRRDAISGYKWITIADTTLDGKDLRARSFRSQTPFFRLNPKKGGPLGVTGGRAAMEAGYNLLLRPLAPGTHTIHEHIKIVVKGKTVYESRPTFKLIVS